MKRPLLIFLAAMIMAIPSQGYSDAPVETYFLGVTQIPDNVLRETKAVLTVNIIDPKAYAEYYNQPNVKQTPYIAVYKKEGNSFKKMGVLEKAQIKTPTGVNMDRKHGTDSLSLTQKENILKSFTIFLGTRNFGSISPN